MRVLLLAHDLYRSIGGGQTFYRRIIDKHPHISFTYFRTAELEKQRRPANATAISPQAQKPVQVIKPGVFPPSHRDALRDALPYAAAVAGQSFDIVDFPDYFAFGSLLRDALAHFGVSYRALVLSMHGNISNSIEHAWASPGDNTLAHRILECEQFVDSDGRYAISPAYRAMWQQRAPLPVHLIDPLSIIDVFPTTFKHDPESSLPDLTFIGRRERLKGPDLFIELCAWLGRSRYRMASAFGEEVFLPDGTSADDGLRGLALARGVSIRLEKPLPPAQLRNVMRDNAYVVLPSRFDSLNLVALESLLQGCPVAVSSYAGVSQYLDTKHPDVSYVKLDLSDWPTSVATLTQSLNNFRNECVRARQSARLLTDRQPSFDITSIYSQIIEHTSRSAKRQPRDLAWTDAEAGAAPLHFDGLTKLKKLVRKYRLEPVARPAYAAMLRARAAWQRRYKPSAVIETDVSHGMIALSHWSERNLDQVAEKLTACYTSASTPFYRCVYWQEIARLERLRGNDLVAAAYEIRLLRLLGADRWAYLPQIRKTLATHNLGFVAHVLAAQYETGCTPDALGDYFEQRYARLRTNPVCSKSGMTLVDDQRKTGETPTVTVVVSLYNAAAKVPFFLRMLQLQTIAPQIELVFVDANSPTDERAAIDASVGAYANNFVYIRTKERESIQAAWNRALYFARGKYVTCLGVDEGLLPDALQTLANELENHSETDWVMADSVVSEVDPNGLYVCDKMRYSRRGGTKESVYLDTTYVSWVGGLYRRDIHDRFGFYDPAFRAAGDTEFKLRIFRHINVRFLNRVLGVFFDYPEQRTTASPLAEIEDAAAWYAYRTSAGLKYLFDADGFQAPLRLLGECLSYRKSYLSHVSTDFTLGLQLAEYLSPYLPDNIKVKTLARDLRNLVSLMRVVEYAPDLTSARQSDLDVASLRDLCRRLERTHARLLPKGATLQYAVTNDNRYEQHSWLWKTIE